MVVIEEKYSVVFVSGSSAGLKIIGETFPFNSQSRLYYTQSNHSSALTIREYAFAKGADNIYLYPSSFSLYLYLY